MVVVGFERTKVGNLGRLSSCDGPPKRPVWRKLKLSLPHPHFNIRRWSVASSSDRAEGVAITKIQYAKLGLAYARCVLEHRIEYGLQFAGRDC